MEKKFFSQIQITEAKLFGGSNGKEIGGCTEFCVSNNGKLIAVGLNTGAILVYDS